MRSLNKLADQVLNSVMAGLKGTTNHPLSKRQIKDELIQLRNRIAEEQFNARKLDAEPLMLSIDTLPVKSGRVRIEGRDDEEHVMTGELPQLLRFRGFNPIKYFGLADRFYPFKIVEGPNFRFFLHDRFSSLYPTVHVEGRRFTIYNTYSLMVKKVALRAAFEDPRECRIFEGVQIDDDAPFPMSDAIADMAIGKLVESYIRYNRSQQPILNIGTDPGLSNRTEQ